MGDEMEVSQDVLDLNPELAEILRARGGKPKPRNNGESSPSKRGQRKTKGKGGGGKKKTTYTEQPDLEAEFLNQWGILQKWMEQQHGLTIPDPEKEHRFYGSKKQWRVPRRFDFAWPDMMLVVEIEGGTWVKGAHVRGARFTRDAIKYNEAAIAGWTVLRFSSDMVGDWQPYKHVQEWMLVRVDMIRKAYGDKRE